jgi:DNA transformation protein
VVSRPIDVDCIRELFSAFGPVKVRRMFGGAGIYADEMMFALIADAAIYLKSDHKTAPAFDREGCGPFVYAKKDGQRAVMSYRALPERLYDDPEEWAAAALGVARQAPAKMPTARSHRKQPLKPAARSRDA